MRWNSILCYDEMWHKKTWLGKRCMVLAEAILCETGDERMKLTWKTILAAAAYIAGILGWIYVGLWQILKRPVRRLVLAQIAGTLSIGTLLGAIVQGFLFLSLAGAVWCVGYMLSEYFKED